MKRRISLCIWILSVMYSFSSYAYEVWYTPSGKSYEIHQFYKTGKQGKVSGHYMVAYRTEHRLNKKDKLISEFSDLFTNLYYFEIPKNIRDSKSYLVTIEAFRDLKEFKKGSVPSMRMTKKCSELKPIVVNHKKTEWNRLRAMEHFNEKKYRQAIGYYRHIKKKVPHDYAQMGNSFLLLGKKSEAVKNLNAGLKTYPKNIMLLNNLAMSTMFKGIFYFEKVERRFADII